VTRSVKDYPVAEKDPESVKGARGKPLASITLDAVVQGEITIEDLRITPEALRTQAEISRDAGRPKLAENFSRAAELVDIPQDVIMQTYELLRPGRAKSKAELEAAAHTMRIKYKADRIAAFIEEAAAVYETRGLFTKRY
jgi:propanediol dehydratase small subunit